MDNDIDWGSVGLGVYLIGRNRRLDAEARAREPHERAKEAAWWAGLTPDQQAAYEAEMRRQQALTVPVQQRPSFWQMFPTIRRLSLLLLFIVVISLAYGAVAGAVNLAQGCGFATSDCTYEKTQEWCAERTPDDGQAINWCVENYDEARRIWNELHQGD